MTSWDTTFPIGSTNVVPSVKVYRVGSGDDSDLTMIVEDEGAISVTVPERVVVVVWIVSARAARGNIAPIATSAKAPARLAAADVILMSLLLTSRLAGPRF